MEQKMNRGPINKWKIKGLDLAQWQNANSVSYTLTKSYKNKKTDQWEKQTIGMFYDHLLMLRDLLEQAIQAGNPDPNSSANDQPAAAQPSNVEYIKHDVKFEDDDLPF
jgi:hypothetical protein